MANRRMSKKKLAEKATEAAEKVETVAKAAAEKAEEAVHVTVDNLEAHMNKPEVKEAAETLTEAVKDAAVNTAKDIKTVAGAVRSKVSDVLMQYNGMDISIPALEKAVKKQAAAKKQKGEIVIYINVSEQAAYYTVNGEGNEEMKVLFSEI